MLRNIAYFFSANLVAKLCGFAVALLLARSLGPASFGEWVTLTLIASYSPILCLGTVEALLKRVPFLIGKGDLKEVKRTERSVQGSILVAGCAALSFGFVAIGLNLPHHVGVPALPFALLTLTIALSYFTGFYYNRLTAYQQFRSVGCVDIVRSCSSLLFIGGLTPKWHLTGALIGLTLQEASALSTAALLSSRASGRVGFDCNLPRIGPLIRVGMPITLLWWSLTLSASVDRLMLGRFIDSAAVGFYSLGLSIWSLFGLIPTVVGRVLYPRVNTDVGREVGRDALTQTVVAPTFMLGFLLVNLQVWAFAALPYLYTYVLPKYKPGLLAGEVLTLGCFFVCLYRNAANYLIAINKEALFFRAILLSLAFNVVVDFFLLRLGTGLAGIALGTSISGALLTSTLWYNALRNLGFSANHAIKINCKMYFPVFLLILLAIAWHSVVSDKASLRTIPVFIVFSSIAVNMALYLLPQYRAEMIRCCSVFQRRIASLPAFARLSNRSAALLTEIN